MPNLKPFVYLQAERDPTNQRVVIRYHVHILVKMPNGVEGTLVVNSPAPGQCQRFIDITIRDKPTQMNPNPVYFSVVIDAAQIPPREYRLQVAVMDARPVTTSTTNAAPAPRTLSDYDDADGYPTV